MMLFPADTLVFLKFFVPTSLGSIVFSNENNDDRQGFSECLSDIFIRVSYVVSHGPLSSFFANDFKG